MLQLLAKSEFYYANPKAYLGLLYDEAFVAFSL